MWDVGVRQVLAGASTNIKKEIIMDKKIDAGKKEEKKGFFARLMDNLDKKMEGKANSGGCCCCSGGDKDKKC